MKKLFIFLFLMTLAYYGQAQGNNGKKILMVVTSSTYPNNDGGVYFPEVSEFYGTVYNYGYRTNDIDMVSPKGGKITIFSGDGTATFWSHSVPQSDKDAINNKLNNTLRPDQVKASDYNIIYYVGGYSSLEDFPYQQTIAKVAADIYESNGIVGLVCDGISGLVPIKLSSGKYLIDGVKATTNGYDLSFDPIDVDQELTNHGGIIVNQNLVSDKRVVTGRGVQPVAVAEGIMALLGKFPTSTESIIVENDFNIYPNPASNKIHITTSGKLTIDHCTVMDMTGKVILNNVVVKNNILDISVLPKGLYGFIFSAEGKNVTKIVSVTR